MNLKCDDRDLKIILIDDDEDDAMLFREAISEINPHAKVEVFCEWKKAIPFLESSNSTPDIIFLDYILPGKRGNELAEELRKNEKFKNVPVVLCSGLGEPLKGESSNNNDIQLMITKPSTYGQLVDLLRKVINSNLSIC